MEDYPGFFVDFPDCTWYHNFTAPDSGIYQRRASTMSKFVIRKVSSGVKFDLRATNGQTVATSEVYKTLASCLRGIESVRKSAPVAAMENCIDGEGGKKLNPKFEMYQDKANQYRFRLRARNGKIIAVSEPYTTRAACENGIDSVRKNADTAETVQE
jgi:uncharacterized protein YegP (UPF0339 family)